MFDAVGGSTDVFYTYDVGLFYACAAFVFWRPHAEFSHSAYGKWRLLGKCMTAHSPMAIDMLTHIAGKCKIYAWKSGGSFLGLDFRGTTDFTFPRAGWKPKGARSTKFADESGEAKLSR